MECNSACGYCGRCTGAFDDPYRIEEPDERPVCAWCGDEIPDPWGGDYAPIERSIKRLYTLDEDATVVTGHGPDTQLGDEMRENPFIRA